MSLQHRTAPQSYTPPTRSCTTPMSMKMRWVLPCPITICTAFCQGHVQIATVRHYREQICCERSQVEASSTSAAHCMHMCCGNRFSLSASAH